MVSVRSSQVVLPDGRAVGYAEYGDVSGKPLLHFHGFPSSRFEAHMPSLNETAERLGARVIVVERPGIGLSDYTPYTITGWPDTVTAFADAIGIDRFAVMGLSAGGKYATACAWKIPDRLTKVGIVSSVCPLDLPGSREALPRQDRLMYALARRAPWLLRMILWKVARDVRTNPYAILSLFSNICDADKEILTDHDVRATFTEAIIGAFEQGTRGVALDWKLEARPRGFSLADIRIPVHIWHGHEDTIQPIDHGKIMAATIADARPAFKPEEGHISLYVRHYEEIVGTLVA